MTLLLPGAAVPEMLEVETRAEVVEVATVAAGRRAARREVEVEVGRTTLPPGPILPLRGPTRDQAARILVPHVPILLRHDRISPPDVQVLVDRDQMDSDQVVHRLAAQTSTWEAMIAHMVAAIVQIPAGLDDPMWGEGILITIMGQAVDRTLAPNQESSWEIVQDLAEIIGLEMATEGTRATEAVGQTLVITLDRGVGEILIRDMVLVQGRVRAAYPVGLVAVVLVAAQAMTTVLDMATAQVIVQGADIAQILHIILRMSIITTIMPRDGTIATTIGTMAIGGEAIGEAPRDGELAIALDIVPGIGIDTPADRGIARGTPMLPCGDLALGHWGLPSMIQAMRFTAIFIM